MRIATWNVDSLNVWPSHVLDRPDGHRPGVLAPGRDSACPVCGAHEARGADKEALR